MTNTDADWLDRPLGRRYALGIFDVANVRTEDGECARDRSVHWATGWLADGECEFLGAWIETEGTAEDRPRMLADLKRRGVERIWHVTGTDVACLQQHVNTAFAGSTCDRLSTEVFPAAPERIAAEVRARLKRGIRRHGSFENEPAALDFLARALQRTERRMDRGGMTTTVRLLPDSGTQRTSPGY